MTIAAPRGWPRLIAISDCTLLPASVLAARLRRLARAARPGTVALLLRDHALSAKERLSLGRELRDAARESRQELWVADRLDLAWLLEADVLHLGEGSASAAAVRPSLHRGMRVSRAWHAPSLADVASAGELADVDALLVSPIIAPRKGRPALGLASLGGLGEQLRARNWAYPLYALGGVSPQNAAACRAAGAHGVAAIGAALADHPEPLLAALEISATAVSGA